VRESLGIYIRGNDKSIFFLQCFGRQGWRTCLGYNEEISRYLELNPEMKEKERRNKKEAGGPKEGGHEKRGKKENVKASRGAQLKSGKRESKISGGACFPIIGQGGGTSRKGKKGNSTLSKTKTVQAERKRDEK